MPRSFLGMTSLTPPRSSRASTPSRSRTPSPNTLLSLKNLRLRVRCGPSYDRATHVNVNVNDANEPTLIDSEHFTGHVVVRVRDYAGVPGTNGVVEEDEEYFSETKDTCSIMFGGWFHVQGKELSVDDVVFGNDFDESIADKLPTGTSLGLKALRMIDPSLDQDLYSHKPWAYSPLLATMNTVHMTSDESSSSAPKYTKLTRMSESTTLVPLHDDNSPPQSHVTSSSDRRKWLSNQRTRASIAFPSSYISGDFCNPFVDFNSFSVQLPYVGLKVDVLKYWTRGDKRQPLRYVCRTRPKNGEEDVVFFVVLFELVGDGVVTHNENMEAGKEGNGERGGIHKDENTDSNTTNANTEPDEMGVD